MSSRLSRLRPRSLQARLTLFGTLLFFSAALLTIALSGFLLHQEFESRMKQSILWQLDRYAMLYLQSPLVLLKALEQEHDQNRLRGTWLRWQHAPGILWETTPLDWEADRATLESVLIIHLQSGRDWSRASRERYQFIQRDNEDPHHPIRFEEEFLMASRVLPDGSVLAVGESLAPVQLFIRLLGRRMFWLFIGIGTVGLLVGWFFTRKMTRPLQDLVSTTETVASGKLSARVPEPDSSGELAELTRLFNQMLERIEHLVNTMNESLDNVAHDLRTPLTRLRNSVESVMTREAVTPEELREALLDAAEETERIQTLLTALMNLAEAGAGTLRLNRKPIQLDELVREICGLYELLAEEKSLSLRQALPEHPVTLEADPVRLRQALGNLLDNAIKFTPDGGTVTLSVRTEPYRAILEVQDSGIGISAEDQPRIFERLYRADKSRRTQGLGLGLSLVQAIVQAHGASIHVSSTPHQGSTFQIVFPLPN
jgi:signal transduction histidine kinase